MSVEKKRTKSEYSDGKRSRKYQVPLFGGDKDTFLIRKSSPGPVGKGQKMSSEYKKQLMEKQRVRSHYAVGEKVFYNYFKESADRIGNTAEIFIGKLESRLGVFVYKAGFAPTIFAARQMVAHKHILVNGKMCNIKSRMLKEGDVVTIKDTYVHKDKVKESLKNHKAPTYIVLDSEKGLAKFAKVPTIMDVNFPFPVNINRIVEFYSK